MTRGGKQRRRGGGRAMKANSSDADSGEVGTVNANLEERFSSRPGFNDTAQTHVVPLTTRSETAYLVRDYFAPSKSPLSHEAWTIRPEIPASDEIMLKNVAFPEAETQQAIPNINVWPSTGWGYEDSTTRGWENSWNYGGKDSSDGKNSAWGSVGLDENTALNAWDSVKGKSFASTPDVEANNASSTCLPDQVNPQKTFSKDAKSSQNSTTISERLGKGVHWVDEEDSMAKEQNVSEEEDDDVLNTEDRNRISGPWPSKNRYLKAHWKLLREEAFRNIRKAANMVKERPMMEELVKMPRVRLYGDTYIRGVTFSNRGFAVRVTFSLSRIKKQVSWEQSDRLKTGSLLVLIAVDQSDICRTAVVAGRPLSLLRKNPPEVDLFFSSPAELEIDCTREWVMVEEGTSYFEGSRHTLQALQKMAADDFPLSEHFVQAEKVVKPPKYLTDHPNKNLNTIFTDEDGAMLYENSDIVNSWPQRPVSEMDDSQLSAVRRILTKRLALVQGPPGTGKTFVSVQALKVLLANMQQDDPPIIITCQTNHALDQLLRHVAALHPSFVRLGGRSKDMEIIKPRTLYEIRKENPVPACGGTRLRRQAMNRIEELTAKIGNLLSPLREQATTISIDTLQEHEVLDHEQCHSLRTGKSEFIEAGRPRDYHDPIRDWGGDEVISAVPKWKVGEPYFQFEEVDPGFEELREEEAENQILEDEEQEFEVLTGPHLAFGDVLAGKPRRANKINNTKAKDMLARTKNLWKVPMEQRGALFRYILCKLKEKILAKVRDLLPAYEAAVQDRKIGNWELDVALIRNQKVIGVTTTGLSKYRGLVAALQPKIVLIEEAAETFEAPVVAACLSTVEHLILVGDHRQLPPHCNVFELESEPWNLGVSLFERMVEHNGVESTLLKRQRRMIPEIRRLLTPIYGNVIEDHPIVLHERPHVPGMGGINSFCFTHKWPEEKDDVKSVFNRKEADMVVAMIRYLIFNGVTPEQITVLTFYNGQRRMLFNLIKQEPDLAATCTNRLKLVTVDSYQGEENDIVMLSLVRCNDREQIGFLDSENRACVALSRAKRGFYIFGDLHLLSRKSNVWLKVIELLLEGSDGIPKRLDRKLPIRCTKHGATTYVYDPDHFHELDGGCERPCPDMLPCGHKCLRKCHAFPHDRVACQEDCEKCLPCGHYCNRACSETCGCSCKSDASRTPTTRGAAREAAEIAHATAKQRRTALAMNVRHTQVNEHQAISVQPAEVWQAAPDILHEQVERPVSTKNPPTQECSIEIERSRQQLDEENARLLFGDNETSNVATVYRGHPLASEHDGLGQPPHQQPPHRVLQRTPNDLLD